MAVKVPPSKAVSLADMQGIIGDATANSVHVIASPPGTGKSWATQEYLVRRIKDAYDDNQNFRVLYATHSTFEAEVRGQRSLGKEAQESINAKLAAVGLPESCRIIRGQSGLSPRDWKAQFVWAVDEFIHVISHAHLRVLLTESPSARITEFMQPVNLIVVDENPIDSLVVSVGLDANKLTDEHLAARITAGKGGDIEQALLDLMEELQMGTIDDIIKFTHHITGVEQRSLTGRAFWEAFQQKVSRPNWGKFIATLSEHSFRRQGRASAMRLVSEFRREYEDPDSHSSQRFGIHFRTDRQKKRYSMSFRADVLHQMPAEKPALVVLDAYAALTEELYQAVFPNYVLHELGETVPLVIEYRRDIGFSRTATHNDRQPARKQEFFLTLSELADGNSEGVFVLAHKREIEALKDPTLYPDWPSEVGTQHWYSGRGSNRWQGKSCVAIHEPIRPGLFQQHFLAALAPNDPSRRAISTRQLRDTEVLQMLHRTRQTNYPRAQRPRIVVGFDCENLEKGGWVTVERRRNVITGGRRNAYYGEQFRILAEEINNLYGAVPHICLVVLGLLKSKPAEDTLLSHVQDKMRQRIERNKRKAPNLARWIKSGSLIVNGQPIQAISENTPTKVQKRVSELPRFRSYRAVGERPYICYAASKTTAHKAMFLLEHPK